MNILKVLTMLISFSLMFTIIGDATKPSSSSTLKSNSYTNGLVWYSLMNDNTGLTVNDLVANNDGVLTNGASFTASYDGIGVLTDGSDDYVTIPHNDMLDVSKYTIMMGVKPVSWTNDYPRFIDHGYANQLSFYRTASDGLVTDLVFSDTSTHTHNTPDISVSNYHIIASKWDGIRTVHYINGTNSSYASMAGAGLQSYNAEFRLGQRVDDGSSRAGNFIYEWVGIWNRGLSDAEIATISADPYSLVESGDTTPPVINSFVATNPPSGTRDVPITIDVTGADYYLIDNTAVDASLTGVPIV